MAKGVTADAALAQVKPRLHFKQEARLKPILKGWRPAVLRQALDILLQAEIDCKTTDYPPSLICERSLLRFATLK